MIALKEKLHRSLYKCCNRYNLEAVDLTLNLLYFWCLQLPLGAGLLYYLVVWCAFQICGENSSKAFREWPTSKAFCWASTQWSRFRRPAWPLPKHCIPIQVSLRDYYVNYYIIICFVYNNMLARATPRIGYNLVLFG